jgi:nitrile hydratase accessory protein
MKEPTVAINELPALPRDQDGPIFNEPWEAQAFALAVRLSEAGCFTWAEWAAILSQEIKAAQARGDPDLGQTYYQHWLNALERICVAKGLVGREDMRRRAEEWRRAYRNTPHGQPVVCLTAGATSEGAALPEPAHARGHLRSAKYALRFAPTCRRASP